ncbi:hypothetical protein [Anaeromyxobacter sp. SG66]|uniref:hypothetical protein n=1 Tax=Anaeromyxobacter sp. SG66 TaxID=2925410 RepID=UPI0035AB900B
MLDLGPGPEGGASEEIVHVLLGEHLAEERQGGQAKTPIPQRSFQCRKAAQHPHRLDAPPGGALAQVERLKAIGPQGRMAGLDEGAAPIELVEVQEEVDLDVSFLSGELAQAQGEDVRLERSGGERGHGMHLQYTLRNTRIPELRRRSRPALARRSPLRPRRSLKPIGARFTRKVCARERPSRAARLPERDRGEKASMGNVSPTATGTLRFFARGKPRRRGALPLAIAVTHCEHWRDAPAHVAGRARTRVAARTRAKKRCDAGPTRRDVRLLYRLPRVHRVAPGARAQIPSMPESALRTETAVETPTARPASTCTCDE